MLEEVASMCKRTACLCVIGAALALPACGDAGSDTAPVTGPRTTPATTELTAAQFEAIERVYVAALALDALRAAGAGSQYELEAATRPLLDACRQLDARDPLLGALRSACSTGARVAFAAHGIADCSHDCTEVYKAVGDAIDRFVAASHAADRALDRVQFAPACTNALVSSPAAYAYYQQLAAAIRMKQHARDSDSGALQAALAMSKAAEMARLQPTGAWLLRELRAGCR
jgi:hypothetical protein